MSANVPNHRRNSGADSQDLFEAHWKAMGKKAFCFRLADQAEVRGRSKGGFTARMRRQPADFVVTHNGEMFYAEVKSTQNTNGPQLNLQQQGQKNYSRMQEAAGGGYYYFIHNLLTNRWYRIEAHEYDHGLTWEWLERNQKRWVCINE